MTTTEDYIELSSLKVKIENKINNVVNVIKEGIVKLDFLSGYRNGLSMIENAATNKLYDDKKPETLDKLKNNISAKINIFKDNINNSIQYPISEESKEFGRGQIAGMAAASKILFKYDVLKKLNEDIAYFKVETMPAPATETTRRR